VESEGRARHWFERRPERRCGPDLLREMVDPCGRRFAAERLMELEVGAKTGADYGEKSGERLAQRNGYRDRDWQTRAGSVELRIPRLRTGSYFPSFLEPRRSVESEAGQRAFQWKDRPPNADGARHCLSDQWRSNGSLQEAYVQGVSTRAMDDLVQAMGGTGISRSQVSRLCEDEPEQKRSGGSFPGE
jgi:putative transposase